MYLSKIEVVSMELKLREIRKLKGLTQTELAELMGVNLRSISSWERGATILNAENIVKVCKALNCTPNDLLGWEEYKAAHALDNQEKELLNNFRSSDSTNKAVILTVAANSAATSKKVSPDTDIGRESVA